MQKVSILACDLLKQLLKKENVTYT